MPPSSADELWDKLVENAVVYGTGFMKMVMNERGVFELAVVPIEDYRYLDAAFDAVNTLPERKEHD